MQCIAFDRTVQYKLFISNEYYSLYQVLLLASSSYSREYLVAVLVAALVVELLARVEDDDVMIVQAKSTKLHRYFPTFHNLPAVRLVVR